jgi:hypothetical protein
MDEIEKVIAKYEDKLNFDFRDDMPEGISGLIINKTVYINKKLSFKDSIAAIAEEIGHYETSTQKNITNYKMFAKEEETARRWSYAKLIPVENIAKYDQSEDAVFLYEIADDLNLPDQIVESAIYMYRLRGKLG